MYRDGFRCSLCGLLMGETAELLAREYGIAREASDAFALGSQRKAARAVADGAFQAELAPVTLTTATGTTTLTADEHPRAETTLDALARLTPTFDVDGVAGIITAGSASGITDGGAAVVLASERAVKAHALTPLARVTGWASAGVDPRRMGIGPVPAVQKLLAASGDRLDRFDLVELNEAFAPQVLAVLRELRIADEKLNVHGGAIALGHPIGATGTRMVVTLVHALRRRQLSRGLATLCVSGGLGMAMGVELTE
jgi:acetyl-CoA C-acetyltransferase